VNDNKFLFLTEQIQNNQVRILLEGYQTANWPSMLSKSWLATYDKCT